MKTYILKPTMTFDPGTVAARSAPGKPDQAQTLAIVNAILPDALKTKPAPTPPAAAARALPPRQPLPGPVIDPVKPMLKLGLDVHLDFIMVVAQKGHSSAMAPRKFTNSELADRVRQWVAEGFQVFCVQESCGFGFTLHRMLVEAGAQSFLITPVPLSDKRKTDKLDARALCQRLCRWLDGERNELAPIRIPTGAEQRRREGTRRRKFLQRLIRMMANRGHAMVAQYLHQEIPSRWWGARNWGRLKSLDPWLLEQLDSLRALILGFDAQIKALEKELLARLDNQVLPKGLGNLTLVELDGEMCDWNRFSNRKQVGSFIGCCPSEHSSGHKRRLGAIDRMGNGRVRAILVEAVWRLLHWQPHWKAAARMKVKLGGGPALRKKSVVALARRLAIDLWRWRTGRATLDDLGWVPA